MPTLLLLQIKVKINQQFGEERYQPTELIRSKLVGKGARGVRFFDVLHVTENRYSSFREWLEQVALD